VRNIIAGVRLKIGKNLDDIDITGILLAGIYFSLALPGPTGYSAFDKFDLVL
jgi:hypothetical protein